MKDFHGSLGFGGSSFLDLTVRAKLDPALGPQPWATAKKSGQRHDPKQAFAPTVKWPGQVDRLGHHIHDECTQFRVNADADAAE